MVRPSDPRLHDIRNLFQVPPLSTKPEMQVSHKSDDEADRYFKHFDEALRSDKNVLFFVTREIGKTTLAHFIAIKVSEGLSDRPRVPIIFDGAPNFATHERFVVWLDFTWLITIALSV